MTSVIPTYLARLPEQAISLKGFIERDAADQKMTVDEYYQTLTDQMKNDPDPDDVIQNVVGLASKFRVSKEDQAEVAGKLFEKGLTDPKLIQEALAAVSCMAIAKAVAGIPIVSNLFYMEMTQR